MNRPRACSCHSSDLYAALTTCPKCRHRSFDAYADACERRACGHVAEPTLDLAEVPA